MKVLIVMEYRILLGNETCTLFEASTQDGGPTFGGLAALQASRGEVSLRSCSSLQEAGEARVGRSRADKAAAREELDARSRPTALARVKAASRFKRWYTSL